MHFLFYIDLIKQIYNKTHLEVFGQICPIGTRLMQMDFQCIESPTILSWMMSDWEVTISIFSLKSSKVIQGKIIHKLLYSSNYKTCFVCF